MVNYALSTTSSQVLIKGIKAEFMFGLNEQIERSAYLNADFKQALQQCYAGAPTPQRMADALYFGLIGTELTNDASRELGAEAASLHGPDRLFDELPTVDRPGTQIRDMKEVARQLAEMIRHGDPSATVLELVGMTRDPLKTRIRVTLTTLLKGKMGGLNLHLGRDDRTLRFPSLSLMESALHYIAGEQAPQFCYASYLISPGLLNAFHELDHRMVALLLEAGSFDGRKDESPLEVLFHDLAHTVDYIQLSPLSRRLAAQFLRIVEDYRSRITPRQLLANPLAGSQAMRLIRRLVLDLECDLKMLANILLEVFSPEYVVEIGEHFLAAAESYQATHTLSAPEREELDRATSIIEKGFARIAQGQPTPSAAVA